MKRATRWRVERARDLASQRLETLSLSRVRNRNRIKKGTRVGVGRTREHFGCSASLYNPPKIHDKHAISDAFDSCEIVRNVQKAQTPARLEFAKEIENLSLDRNIQGCCRFVKNEKSRFQGESTCHSDSLSLTTGKLVRKSAHVFRAKTNGTKVSCNPLLSFPSRNIECGSDRFSNHVANSHTRIEGRIGVLKDDAQLTPHRVGLPGRQEVKVLAIKHDPSSVLINQAQQGQGNRALSTSRFAY